MITKTANRWVMEQALPALAAMSPIMGGMYGAARIHKLTPEQYTILREKKVVGPNRRTASMANATRGIIGATNFATLGASGGATAAGLVRLFSGYRANPVVAASVGALGGALYGANKYTRRASGERANELLRKSAEEVLEKTAMDPWVKELIKTDKEFFETYRKLSIDPKTGNYENIRKAAEAHYQKKFGRPAPGVGFSSRGSGRTGARSSAGYRYGSGFNDQHFRDFNFKHTYENKWTNPGGFGGEFKSPYEPGGPMFSAARSNIGKYVLRGLGAAAVGVPLYQMYKSYMADAPRK